MRSLLSGILLCLLLVAALGVPAHSASGGEIRVAVAMTADGTHHQQRDEDTGQPACAAMCCECHGCPHASQLAAITSSGPQLHDQGGEWLNEIRGGVSLDVDVPPPRNPNVEST